AAPGAAVGADALLRFQVPDALLVEEVLAAEGADGAQIDDVAGQLVVQWLAGEDVDLGVAAAVDDLQLGGAGNLAREADAARAHDAAVGKERDLVGELRLVGRLVLLVHHPAFRAAE